MIRTTLLAASMLLLSGCSSISVGANGEARYRYSAFDFSGDSWAVQQRRCAAMNMKPLHLGTDCGFWTCVSHYQCQAQ